MLKHRGFCDPASHLSVSFCQSRRPHFQTAEMQADVHPVLRSIRHLFSIWIIGWFLYSANPGSLPPVSPICAATVISNWKLFSAPCLSTFVFFLIRLSVLIFQPCMIFRLLEHGFGFRFQTTFPTRFQRCK